MQRLVLGLSLTALLFAFSACKCSKDAEAPAEGAPEGAPAEVAPAAPAAPEAPAAAPAPEAPAAPAAPAPAPAN